MQLEHTDCSNCHQDDCQEVFTRDRYGIPWTTVTCNRCGMMYSNPRMTAESTQTFYASDEYRQIYGGGHVLMSPDEMFDLDRVDRSQEYHRLSYFDFVVENFSDITSVAEIGAGGGWNLIPFINAQITCQGYEFSQRLIESGRRRGIDMIDLAVSSLAGEWDLIMMRHVLEHVLDPVNELRDLRGFLTPNGKIFIEVPGIVEKLPSVQNAHNHYFSEKTLESVFGQAGFKVEAVKSFKRNGFIMAIATPIEIEQAAMIDPDEQRRVARIVRTGRRGMYKGAFVDKLPRTLRNVLGR